MFLLENRNIRNYINGGILIWFKLVLTLVFLPVWQTSFSHVILISMGFSAHFQLNFAEGGDKLRADLGAFTRLLYFRAWRFGISTGTNRLSLSIFSSTPSRSLSFTLTRLPNLGLSRGSSPLRVLCIVSFVVRQTFHPSNFKISVDKPLSLAGLPWVSRSKSLIVASIVNFIIFLDQK